MVLDALTVTRWCCGSALRLLPQISASSSRQCDSRTKCWPITIISSGWSLITIPSRRLRESSVTTRATSSTIALDIPNLRVRCAPHGGRTFSRPTPIPIESEMFPRFQTTRDSECSEVQALCQSKSSLWSDQARTGLTEDVVSCEILQQISSHKGVSRRRVPEHGLWSASLVRELDDELHVIRPGGIGANDPKFSKVPVAHLHRGYR
jgi:hypothetical protein